MIAEKGSERERRSGSPDSEWFMRVSFCGGLFDGSRIVILGCRFHGWDGSGTEDNGPCACSSSFRRW